MRLADRSDCAELQHHRKVVANNPVLGYSAILEPVDVYVLDRERLAFGRRDAAEHTSTVRSAPGVVTDHEVAFGDEPHCRPVRVRYSAHYSLHRTTERVEPDLQRPVRLMVRDVVSDEPLEVDLSGRPLVVELLDDGLVLVRCQRSVGRISGIDLSRLNKPLAHPPLVLAEQHTAELGESEGRIVEGAENRLAILDRERNEILFVVECEKEYIGGFLEPGLEQELGQGGNVRFQDRHTGESHAGDATRRGVQANQCVA